MTEKIAKPMDEAKKKVLNLISSLLKLLVGILLVRSAGAILGDIVLFEVGQHSLSTRTTLNLLNFAVIIYFGYRVLVNLAYFLDKAVELIVRRFEAGEKAPRRIAHDITYVIIIVLVWEAISPLLKQVPEVGDYMVRGLGVILLFIGFLLLYDLAKTTYGVIKKELDKVLELIAMKIEGAEAESNASARENEV